MTNAARAPAPNPRRLAEIVALDETEAVANLRQAGWWTPAAGERLAEWALTQVEANPLGGERALALGAQIAQDFADNARLAGWLAYARARRAVVRGDLPAAEADLRATADAWRAAEPTLIARSALGLTQVLAMQGKLPEAEQAAADAVLAVSVRPEGERIDRWMLARALRNLATVYVYQERHGAARDAYRRAQEELTIFAGGLTSAEAEEMQAAIDDELGHLALNLASALTFLDAPEEAEAALLDAQARFDQAGDRINRGRARTNLGRLYLRRGDYAAALARFDQARADLIGEETPDMDGDPARYRLADELLLEHALAYLALNLLPEAERALARAELLFRQTDQPYELAQTRYTQGMLLFRQGSYPAAAAALDDALELYTQLDNTFWRNRTRMAQAQLAVVAGEAHLALATLDELLGSTAATTHAGAVAWDQLGLIDAWLLRLQLALERGDVEDAGQAAAQIEEILGLDPAAPPGRDPDNRPGLPNLTMQLWRGRGRIAAAAGNPTLARTYFAAAVDLLDTQRSSLPLEELRTAYLDDKMAYYADLVLSLLDLPEPGEEVVADAFAVVERARSRALLERLLASVEVEETGGDEAAAGLATQRESLRRQLHWLYNRLLGDEGSRHLDGRLSEEVAAHEAALQRIEWRSAPLLAQAEPVQLDALQRVLGADRQAVVYYIAGDEVMAFVVDGSSTTVVRRVASYAAVQRAQSDLRFQLGRAELGADYVRRHAHRLQTGARHSLHALYTLLVAPLSGLLTAPRQLIVPFGALHLVPFHALWDGERYWLETVEVSYVPSASIAVHLQREEAAGNGLRFAGFAPYDARIPQAQAEIDAAATYFAEAAVYQGEAATLAQVNAAAAVADVLHLATHGLFRPDNSFFSALKLADGWLDVRAIYRMRLRAALVVLSACESGMGQVRGGDEVVGLVRGFLAAGAQKMIASLWNVNDLRAAELMRYFYDQLCAEQRPSTRTLSPAAALRAAQIWAIRQDQHPYFWASFYAIG